MHPPSIPLSYQPGQKSARNPKVTQGAPETSCVAHSTLCNHHTALFGIFFPSNHQLQQWSLIIFTIIAFCIGSWQGKWQSAFMMNHMPLASKFRRKFALANVFYGQPSHAQMKSDAPQEKEEYGNFGHSVPQF